MKYIDIISKRRSIYDLNKNILISESELNDLIISATKYTPSAFNSQTSRLIVLTKEKHEELWDLILEEIKKVASKEGFEKTIEKINSFKAGFGTILYFEELETVRSLEEKFPTYKASFEGWSMQSNAMLQYSIWTALSDNNIGASLQHYNPIIDEAIREKYNVSKTWKLYAQMPFGGIGSRPNSYEVNNLDKRVIFK